jgi:hypothetical protein
MVSLPSGKFTLCWKHVCDVLWVLFSWDGVFLGGLTAAFLDSPMVAIDFSGW